MKSSTGHSCCQHADRPLLSVLKDAAVLLGASEWQTRCLVESGALPSTRLEGVIYIPTRSILEYVDAIAQSA